MRSILFCVLLVCVSFAVGCGSNCRVTGKVTFPNGDPVAVGEVHFEGKAGDALGTISSTGTYSMAMGEKSGVPAGEYRVYLLKVHEKGPEQEFGGMVMMPTYISLIDSKYRGPSTSGLSCNVTGSTKYDIVVDPAE